MWSSPSKPHTSLRLIKRALQLPRGIASDGRAPDQLSRGEGIKPSEPETQNEHSIVSRCKGSSVIKAVCRGYIRPGAHQHANTSQRCEAPDPELGFVGGAGVWKRHRSDTAGRGSGLWHLGSCSARCFCPKNSSKKPLPAGSMWAGEEGLNILKQHQCTAVSVIHREESEPTADNAEMFILGRICPICLLCS